MSPGAGRVAWGIVTIVSKERYLTKTQNGRYQQKIFNFYILFVHLNVTLHNKIKSYKIKVLCQNWKEIPISKHKKWNL